MTDLEVALWAVAIAAWSVAIGVFIVEDEHRRGGRVPVVEPVWDFLTAAVRRVGRWCAGRVHRR